MDKDLEQFKSQSIQEGLKMMAECPLCKQAYSEQKAKVIEEKNSAHLVHITCPHCLHSILALIIVSKVGMSSVGMVTDLNVNDVRRLKRLGPITEDELLNFYSLLQKEKLNFN